MHPEMMINGERISTVSLPTIDTSSKVTLPPVAPKREEESAFPVERARSKMRCENVMLPRVIWNTYGSVESSRLVTDL